MKWLKSLFVSFEEAQRRNSGNRIMEFSERLNSLPDGPTRNYFVTKPLA